MKQYRWAMVKRYINPVTWVTDPVGLLVILAGVLLFAIYRNRRADRAKKIALAGK